MCWPSTTPSRRPMPAIQTFYAAGQQFDLVTSSAVAAATVNTDGDGKVDLTVPGYGYVVYKATQAIPASGAAPAIAFSTLTTDQEVQLGYDELDGNQVPQRMEVGVNVGNNRYNEVTFAVRETGAQTFTVIGTDDNPPYRIFYDASQWPAGTTARVHGRSQRPQRPCQRRVCERHPAQLCPGWRRCSDLRPRRRPLPAPRQRLRRLGSASVGRRPSTRPRSPAGTRPSPSWARTAMAASPGSSCRMPNRM